MIELLFPLQDHGVLITVLQEQGRSAEAGCFKLCYLYKPLPPS